MNLPKGRQEGLRIGKTHGHNESKVCFTRWPCDRHTHIGLSMDIDGKMTYFI
jgi:hypothetical protein